MTGISGPEKYPAIFAFVTAAYLNENDDAVYDDEDGKELDYEESEEEEEAEAMRRDVAANLLMIDDDLEWMRGDGRLAQQREKMKMIQRQQLVEERDQFREQQSRHQEEEKKREGEESEGEVGQDSAVASSSSAVSSALVDASLSPAASTPGNDNKNRRSLSREEGEEEEGQLAEESLMLQNIDNEEPISPSSFSFSPSSPNHSALLSP